MIPHREPQIIELAREGDNRRFLCLMEIVKGEIYGGVAELNHRQQTGANASIEWARAFEGAFRRARERAELREPLPPGSDWKAFR